MNVEKFIGSTLGGLQLAYPERWNSNFIGSNPTLQGKFYQIIKAKDGVFVAPGDGVRLPSGKIIGRDIIINARTSMSAYIKADGVLLYKKQPLVRKLTFVIGDWDNPMVGISALERVGKLLKEFNTALPYAKKEGAVARMQQESCTTMA